MDKNILKTKDLKENLAKIHKTLESSGDKEHDGFVGLLATDGKMRTTAVYGNILTIGALISAFLVKNKKLIEVFEVAVKVAKAEE